MTTTRKKAQINMACDLMARWGLVAAVPDGENSDGSMRSRLMTPAEIVARACETAEMALAEFVARGWYEMDDQ